MKIFAYLTMESVTRLSLSVKLLLGGGLMWLIAFAVMAVSDPHPNDPLTTATVTQKVFHPASARPEHGDRYFLGLKFSDGTKDVILTSATKYRAASVGGTIEVLASKERRHGEPTRFKQVQGLILAPFIALGTLAFVFSLMMARWGDEPSTRASA